MLQQRNFPTLLTRLTPAPKLWFALGLTLAIILVKNLWFDVAGIPLSTPVIVHQKQKMLF